MDTQIASASQQPRRRLLRTAEAIQGEASPRRFPPGWAPLRWPAPRWAPLRWPETRRTALRRPALRRPALPGPALVWAAAVRPPGWLRKPRRLLVRWAPPGFAPRRWTHSLPRTRWAAVVRPTPVRSDGRRRLGASFRRLRLRPGRCRAPWPAAGRLWSGRPSSGRVPRAALGFPTSEEFRSGGIPAQFRRRRRPERRPARPKARVAAHGRAHPAAAETARWFRGTSGIRRPQAWIWTTSGIRSAAPGG